MMPKSDRVTTVSAHRHIRRDRSVAFIKILIANKPKCTAMYVGTITAEMFAVQSYHCCSTRANLLSSKGLRTRIQRNNNNSVNNKSQN